MTAENDTFASPIITNAMNILLLGAGGREHALAWKMAQSHHCDALYIAPGNPGTAGIGLGESDVLRRGMSGKFRSREEFQKVKLLNSMFRFY